MTDNLRHPAVDVIHGRISASSFDPRGQLDDVTVRALMDDAVQAPSSFNIQHWRFICVRDPERKKRLRALAYGQRQVEDAAVTFVVLGDVRGHERLGEILEPSVERGVISQSTADSWVKQSDRIYADREMARDEAIRSASLASMNLMISAAAHGLVSAPLIGFDPEGLRRELELDDRYLPVMLLCVGQPGDENTPRKIRLPIDEIFAFERCPEF